MSMIRCALSMLLLTACGSSDAPDTTAPPTVPTEAMRVAAARATAEKPAGLCADVRPFYWEIGDRNGVRVSGSVTEPGNGTTITAQTLMPIASASKWIYGAYVAERRAGVLSAEDIQFLTFRSGYTNFAVGGCDVSDTVAGFVARATNGAQTTATIDRFFYDGGHMQKHGSLPSPGMDLGALTNAALAGEVRRVLGTEIALSYTQPQLAGGIRTTAADYAVFLRKVLNGQLRIASLLGAHATCTNPATCTTALSTPIRGGVSWHYSIGHWVEDDPVSGDGAFSSAGAFGFYPWISADKSLYGVLARLDAAGGGNASALCGASIRKAWVTGAMQ